MLAQAFQTPFDLSQPAGQILAVVLFLIPGLNCTWIIERLAGRTPLSGTERLFRAIAWSLLIYAVASPWLLRIGQRVASGSHPWPWEPILGLAAIEFAAPLALGLAVVFVRRAQWFKSSVKSLTRLDPQFSSWDFAFAPQGPFLVRARLKTGARVGRTLQRGIIRIRISGAARCVPRASLEVDRGRHSGPASTPGAEAFS